MTAGAIYRGLPPKVLARRTKKRPFPPHRLRKGWRWLTIGEWTRPGDLCCDPRVMPVRIEYPFRIVHGCHPVQTPISGEVRAY